jgi:hypothetical protein
VKPGEMPDIPEFLQRKRPEGGDRKAQQVIDLYRMHCDCPNDPGAPPLCEAAFHEWRKRIHAGTDSGQQGESNDRES